MTSKLNRTLIAATSFLLIACGQNKNGDSNAIAHSNNDLPNEITTWRAVYFDWSAEEIYPEVSCAVGRVTLRQDRTIEVRDCGEIRKAKISELEAMAFEQKIEPMIASQDKPISCSGVAIADYEQTWKLVNGEGRTVPIFEFNIRNTCGRVSNVDEANDYLYVLKEKYFPRTEEGEYAAE